MTIAVSVQNWKFTARNNIGGIRQERCPQSATAYSFETLTPTIGAAQTTGFMYFDSFETITGRHFGAEKY